MKRILALYIFCLPVIQICAQKNYWNFKSPYNLSFKEDLITGGTSLITYFTGTYLVHNEDLPSFETGSFTREDIDRINFIDRWVAGRWDIEAKATGLVFKRSSKIGAVVSLAVFPGNLKSRASLCIIYLEGYLMTQGLTSLAKGTTDRYRPFTYMTMDQINHLEGKDREQFLSEISGNDIEDSFFSGDASSTAYNFIFIAKTFSDYFPDSKIKYGIWGASVTGTAIQAYFRSKSGKHFPTDVIVGSLVGGSIGFLVPHIHKELLGKKLSLNPGNYGLTLTYNF